MTAARISVVTPTWRRNDLLLERCIPSVRAQTHPAVEHIIVSDGPDEELRRRIEALPVRFSELPEHDDGSYYGHRARMRGIELAESEFIAYIDDDDAWRPDHLSVLMSALEQTGAPWAYSRCAVHLARGDVRIGDGPLAHGRIIPSLMILHRREVLKIQGWVNDPGAPDWNLVRSWLDAGLEPVSADVVTCDYYPGSSFDAENKIPASLRPWRAREPARASRRGG